ncbi:hypothetical protein [Psychroflexus aestuariivivens]|uniref:hypothetical protein n=1 Tax=Psychroflexus aestuariivivens TaxID=1795040 RepID=UPI000FD88DF5|nr:hypothetical protein [Psychroflexus aestuariivivens]
MRLLILFLVSIQCVFGQVKNDLDNNISVEVSSENEFLINGKSVDFDNISQFISNYISQHSDDKNFDPYVTLIANENTSGETIDHLKNAIKKTSIKVLNLQRQVIDRYNDGQEVNDETLKQYNTLVKDWENLSEEARYYRPSELKFVASVSKRMTFDQRIRNEKLPSYLPIVKAEPIKNDLSSEKMKSWKTDENILVFHKGQQLSNETLSSLKVDDFFGYRLKKRIIDEKRKIIIELINHKENSDSISF